MFKLTYRSFYNLVSFGSLLVIAFFIAVSLAFGNAALLPHSHAFFRIFCIGVAVISTSIASAIAIELKRFIAKRIRRRRSGILEDPIPANHGKTFAELIPNLCGEEFEYVAYFTKNGRKICESTLKDPDHTRPPMWYWYRSVTGGARCVSVHNHPTNSISCFSIPDIMSAMHTMELCSVVVTGKYCFVLEFPSVVPRRERDQIRKLLHEFTVDDGELEIDYMPEDEEAPVIEIEENKLMWIYRCVALAERFGFNFWMSSVENCSDILAERLRNL